MSVPKIILENPKISVIIPAYNAQKFIEEAIDSVLNQTLPAYEIIVIDDGSTDETSKLISNKYSNKVKLIRQQNKGAPSARNLGIKASKGNIIQFLDADDIILPNKFEEQIDFWKRNPYFDIVYCDFINFYHYDYPQEIPIARPKPQGNLLNVFLSGETIGIHTALVPKYIFTMIGGFNESLRHNSDQWFWILCSLKGFTFGYFPKVLALRRLHDTNLTKDRLSQLKYSILLFERIISLSLPKEIKKNVIRQLANNYMELAIEEAKVLSLFSSIKSLNRSRFYRFMSANLGSRREKLYCIIDLLLWVMAVFDGIVRRSK
jgi:glycosyltransferase involved in cell wall biosynthesis